LPLVLVRVSSLVRPFHQRRPPMERVKPGLAVVVGVATMGRGARIDLS
jgi:hypothetical protein